MLSAIVYTNEHLIYGQLGHFFVVLSFVASLLACAAYFFSTKATNETEANTFLKIGRWSFFTVVFAVFSIATILFFIIYSHLFEYHYAWRHSSLTLPTHYMISCFWEGQEGSFLLWQFWQSLLGLVLVFTAKEWESRVMFVIAISQAFLSSMLLGIHVPLINLDFTGKEFLTVFYHKIGSNPFELLRHAMDNAPIFSDVDYLVKYIKDGNGLNPLLQNYWMVIHPPVLFLGFSSTIVPFAFAIAGWWKKDLAGWTKAVWPWSLFSGAVLSLGIMMGAAWAYEALTFGGFWAWDPVENASIMPWLTLIAGIHTLLAYKHSGHAQRTTFVLFSLTFIGTLYASFLTRSGILGETSVHAFTDLGLGGQLIFFIGTFIFIFLFLLIKNFNIAKSPTKEEHTYSREFWLFICALILLVSLIQITFTTSIPVFNKLFHTELAPPTKPIEHYNKIQIWIGILLTVLSAVIQYLRYNKTDIKLFIRKIIVVKLIALAITIGLVFYFRLSLIAHWLFLFGGVFSVLANTNYIVSVLNGKIKIAGGSVAHIGFGLMMIGILLAAEKQEVLSHNTSGIDLGEAFDSKSKQENMLLYKNVPTQMGEYWLTYLGDSTELPNIYYKVNYQRKNADGQIVENFNLYPNAQINPKMGLISSPDTKHYLSQDIYTHITSVPNNDKKDQQILAKDYKFYEVATGDTIFSKNHTIIISKVSATATRKDYVSKPNDITVAMQATIYNSNTSFTEEAIYLIRENMAVPMEAINEETGVRFFISQVVTSKNKLEVGVAEQKPAPNYIILKAMVFPYINVLWLGTIVLIIGFIISMLHRIKQNKKQKVH
jgi:cytochrome c-type biogenesis protein CcmF